MENWFVVVMGLVTVFAVLILIIALCWLFSLIGRIGEKKEEDTVPAAESTAPASAIPNRGELAAALSVAIAEYSGTDASAIRILSIKKI